ncbi:hypothetical protein ABT262_29365 [Amycolatopsis mediterranei]|nr:hypothetical protein [Amycolatopsis mediterranei]UZF76417.1 hypothetical protein ISP_007233 [Amycolatopsis mediterranei]
MTAFRFPSALVERYMTCQASALSAFSSGTAGRHRTTSPGCPAGSGEGGV